MIRIFCSKGHGRPLSELEQSRGPGGPDVLLDEGLLEHISGHIEFFNADGEAAEQLAGRLSRKRFSALTKPVLPNLLIVNHDLAHGSRRISARPWKADPVLDETIKTIVTQKKSIVSLIQESYEFGDWFAQNKSQLSRQIGIKVRNLSLARHRFDSTSKPISRAATSMYALIKTADQIARLRRPTSQEVVKAKEFLNFISAERVLLVAMLADAGQENIRLTRLCDKETTNSEDLPWQVESLIQRVTMLFVDGEVLEVGHTKWVLEMLRTVPHNYFIDGVPKTIGGRDCLPRPVIDRCLARMASWVKMAQSVVEAEFPDFRVLAAMGVFSLTEGNLRGSGSRDCFATQCERVAKFFKLDAATFVEQLNDILPFAKTVKDFKGVSNKEAWRRALGKVGFRSATHPSDALLRPLQAWVAWSPSTSGLEQNFSAMERVYGKRVSSLLDSGLLDLLTLVVEHEQVKKRGERQKVLHAAQDLWLTHFGSTRRCVDPHLHKGVAQGSGHPEGPKNGKTYKTEAAFLREREAQVHRRQQEWIKAGKRKSAQSRIDQASASTWTASMQAEVDFQAAKRLRRMVHAAAEHQVLPQEMARQENFEDAKANVEKKAAAQEKRALSSHLRKKAVLDSGTNPALLRALQGRAVFFSAGDPDGPGVRARLQQLKLVVTRSRIKADAVVVDNVVEPGQRNLWQLVLHGGIALSQPFLEGGHGQALAYCPAARPQRSGSNLLHALVADCGSDDFEVN